MHFDDDWDSFGTFCRNPDCTLPSDHLKNPNTQSCTVDKQTEGSIILGPAGESTNSTPSVNLPSLFTQMTEKCRHEPTAVFRVKESGISFFGGSDSKVDDYAFDGLVVCLLGRDDLIGTKKPIRSTGDWAKKLTNYMDTARPHPNYMTIDWPDYGIPPVLPGFFKELHDLAKEKKTKNILFYCMGGHGRTGTALAATLIEVCNMNSEEATEWIHDYYCEEAIESMSQKNFLRDLAGEAPIVPNYSK